MQRAASCANDSTTSPPAPPLGISREPSPDLAPETNATGEWRVIRTITRHSPRLRLHIDHSYQGDSHVDSERLKISEFDCIRSATYSPASFTTSPRTAGGQNGTQLRLASGLPRGRRGVGRGDCRFQRRRRSEERRVGKECRAGGASEE